MELLRLKSDELKGLTLIAYMEKNYKGKNFTGSAESYYESGQLQYQINYKNGKAEGICKDYYESGQLSIERNYKKGKLDGKIPKYYESGTMESISYYNNGKRDEKKSKYWTEDGNELELFEYGLYLTERYLRRRGYGGLDI